MGRGLRGRGRAQKADSTASPQKVTDTFTRYWEPRALQHTDPELGSSQTLLEEVRRAPCSSMRVLLGFPEVSHTLPSETARTHLLPSFVFLARERLLDKKQLLSVHLNNALAL